jgi:hypothetical protein
LSGRVCPRAHVGVSIVEVATGFVRHVGFDCMLGRLYER